MNDQPETKMQSPCRMDGDLARCSYMLPKKKRYCRMLVKPGKKFCGEHAAFDPVDQDRIFCPLDPKHTVNRVELEKHLTLYCSARLPDDPWIKENYNVVADDECGEKIEDDDIAEKKPLQFSEEEIASIATKVDAAYSKFAADVVHDSILTTPVIANFLDANPKQTDLHMKHLVQQSSIIGNLAAHGLLIDQDDSCLIELGAGKAQLTYWLAKTIPKCRFLLIDRCGARNKHDNKAIQENESLKVERVRCSVENLDLSRVESIQHSRSLVAVCKHFCGKATDCGVICLQNAIKNGLNLSGFALAPCCHHKSDFTQYVGKPFLREIGITTKEDFAVLRLLATWATCGFGKSRPQDDDRWSVDEKESLGRKAKALLELGRAKCLEELGYDVSVWCYVPETISPENLLIIGTKK